MDQTSLISMFLALGITGMFGIALFEKLVPIVPSYLILLTLGAVAPDGWTLLKAWIATVAGSAIGTGVLYLVGRYVGEQRVLTLVKLYGRYVFFSFEKYQRLARYFRSKHLTVTFIGQLIPVARIYLALPAGVLSIRPSAFLIASTMGIACYNSLFLLVGYALRNAGHDPLWTGVLLTIFLVAIEVIIAYVVRLLRRGPAMISRS